MKQVMTRAWEIAKEAVVKFGGSSVEYLSEALKLAWKEVKGMTNKLVEEYVKIAKEAETNINYPIVAFGLEEGDYQGAEEILFKEHGNGRTFEEYMKDQIQSAKKSLAERKKHYKIVEKYEKELRKWVTENTDPEAWGFDRVAQLKKHVEETISEKEEAFEYQKACTRIRKELLKGNFKPQNEPGLTGPVYDDDEKPVYF